jgi:hypothetical protein
MLKVVYVAIGGMALTTVAAVGHLFLAVALG